MANTETQFELPPPRQIWGRLAIGLTGGIGCGKTTVSDLFAALGVSVIDSDLVAHALTVPGGAAMPAIAARFGADFVQENGALDRAKMRAHVFGNIEEKHALEAILHPMISQQCALQAQQAQGHYLMFAVPLLVESSHWQQRVERILVIDCPLETQITRVMQRNNLSREQVLAIIHHQVTREQRLAVADDVIDNQGKPAALKAQINRLHKFYLRLAAS